MTSKMKMILEMNTTTTIGHEKDDPKKMRMIPK